MNVRFREEHLRSFGAASLDFNPLHVSESYARRTSSGERVVYGMLGFLACLRKVPVPANRIPSGVRIDFKSPLFLDVEYTIAMEQEAPENVRIALLDGRAIMMRARLQFRDGTPQNANLPETGIAPRRDSRRLEAPDFAQKLSFRGTYAPPHAAYSQLLDLLGIDRRTWGDALPVAALCSSYMTGMELPGERATWSGLRLEILTPRPEAPFTFEIALGSHNAQFGLVQSQFTLGGANGIWARGEMSSIVRHLRSRNSEVRVEPGSGRFEGKSALIVGASRGLGAAMALDLVAEGGTVVGVYAQSREDADELLAASRNLPGRLIMERGEAADLNSCIELKSRLRAELGRLDLLVCNAAPAIQSLRVEEACYDRIRDYLAKGFALAAAPLSCFLELISASGGCVLTISSSAVEEPPALWPHYVALKTAVEGLVRAVAVANPKVTFWIARPGRILTDLSDTPMGQLDAETPQSVSRRILEHVWGNASPGTVQFCR